MKQCIAEVLETQSEIIQLQRNVIDRLAATLLQHGMIEEEELAMMQQAADLQRGIKVLLDYLMTGAWHAPVNSRQREGL